MSIFDQRHFENEANFFDKIAKIHPEFTYVKCGGESTTKIDGLIVQNGNLIGCFEYKHRENPLSYFQKWGTFVVDESKQLFLKEMSQKLGVKAYIFVETSDDKLFSLELFDNGKASVELEVEHKQVWENSLKRRKITKNVVHIPINLMKEVKKTPQIKVVKKGLSS